MGTQKPSSEDRRLEEPMGCFSSASYLEKLDDWGKRVKTKIGSKINVYRQADSSF